MKKSERTKNLILAAATTLFSERGYERTTIRDVAERADIDPAMVIRYFKNKETLFAQAASVDLELPALTALDPTLIGRMLIEHFLAIWEGDKSDRGMTVLLRSSSSNELAAAKMREAFMGQVLPIISAVGDPETSRRRAGLVSTQLLGLAMCRYVLQVPPVVELTRDELIESVAPVLQMYAMGSTQRPHDD